MINPVKFGIKWLRLGILLYLAMAIMSCLVLLSFEYIYPLNWNVIARVYVVVGSFLFVLVGER